MAASEASEARGASGARRRTGETRGAAAGWAVAAAFTLLLPGVAAGQGGPAGFCFPAEPLPECRVGGLVEAAVMYRFFGNNPIGFEDDRAEVTWEVGALWNRDERSAVGATFLIGSGEYRPRLGVKLRYRRWLDDRSSVEAAVGPMTHSTSVEAWGVGAMGELAVDYRDWVGAFGRVEVLPVSDGGVTTAGYGGVRLGSWPAIVGSGAAGLLILAWLLTVDFQ